MAEDVFLKLDGIKGESQDAQHKDEIHIGSFRFGVEQKPETAGGVAKVELHDIVIRKAFDKSSTALALACCTAKPIKTGHIVVRRAGEKPLEYIKMKLENVIVTKYRTAAGDGNDVVGEEIALNFSKYFVEYYEQKEDGSGKPGAQAGWDVKAHAKL